MILFVIQALLMISCASKSRNTLTIILLCVEALVCAHVNVSLLYKFVCVFLPVYVFQYYLFLLIEMLVRFSQPNFTASESEDRAEVTLEVVVPHSNISGEYVTAEHSIEFNVDLKTLDGSAIGEFILPTL